MIVIIIKIIIMMTNIMKKLKINNLKTKNKITWRRTKYNNNKIKVLMQIKIFLNNDKKKCKKTLKIT